MAVSCRDFRLRLVELYQTSKHVKYAISEHRYECDWTCRYSGNGRHGPLP